MILLDINILLYAFRTDAPNHEQFREWLQDQINSGRAFGLSDLVLSGFIRIVTHPRIFNPPTPIEAALNFVQTLKSHPCHVPINPGPGQWEIFTRLCRLCEAKGNMVADAYLAALALESGSEWITTDRDYSRFPGLKWRHPLQKNK